MVEDDLGSTALARHAFNQEGSTMGKLFSEGDGLEIAEVTGITYQLGLKGTAKLKYLLSSLTIRRPPQNSSSVSRTSSSEKS